MEVNENDISHLKLTIVELKIKLDTVCAQNERLSEENAKLKHENNRLKTDYNVSSNIGIETRMRLHHLESEREDLNAALQELKVKYSKLYDRYTTKARREKALEQFYNKQKTMTFGMPRNSTLDASIIPNHTKPTLKTEDSSAAETSSNLQQKLTEAYDIIAGLEFELESVNFLESENERMRKELEHLKSDAGQLQDTVSCASASSDGPLYVNRNDLTDDMQSVKITSRRSLPTSPPPVVDRQDEEGNVYDEPVLRNVASKREMLQKRLEVIYSKK